MGRTASKHTCALGGFTPKGMGVIQHGGELLSGREFHFEVRITAQLVDFVNDDVLGRIRAEARYERAIKLDDHILFLVHGPAAESFPSDATVPFVNSFKGILGLLEIEDEDTFHVLKYGSELEPYRATLAGPTDPLEGVMAVSSETGPFISIEHN